MHCEHYGFAREHFVTLRDQESWIWFDPVYRDCARNSCTNTLTVTVSGPGVSDTETLSDDGMTRPSTAAGPAWILRPSLPYAGELWVRTVSRMIDVSSATQSADATLQFQITEVLPVGSYQETASGTFQVGRLATLVDPVPELQNGNQLLTNPETLATLGTLVTGVAADSASRVVLRIRATQPGQRVILTLLNDQNQVRSNPTRDGTITNIQGMPSNGQVTLTAVNTSKGPMAFAIYRPPPDFSPTGSDNAAVNRAVTLQWQIQGTSPPINDSMPLTIWRPPVVLVHGLWANENAWGSFTGITTDGRFGDQNYGVQVATYDFPIMGSVSASFPFYDASILAQVRTNALGIAVNAPFVLAQFQEMIQDFRIKRQAAATQVDVIAHSLGGLVVRASQYMPQFADFSSFGIGNVHKLITIGTPHLGTPLETQLIQGNNPNVRKILADHGNVSLSIATVGGVPGVDGAVGDLEGDGFGSGLAYQLNVIARSSGHYGQSLPLATIAGKTTQANLASLDNTVCGLSICPAAGIRTLGSPDPLAASLTSTGWNSVFGQDNDAIVPVISQQNGSSVSPQVPPLPVTQGVIHSAGAASLGFTPPDELGSATIQGLVIQLLNASIQQGTANLGPFLPVP